MHHLGESLRCAWRAMLAPFFLILLLRASLVASNDAKIVSWIVGAAADGSGSCDEVCAAQSRVCREECFPSSRGAAQAIFQHAHVKDGSAMVSRRCAGYVGGNLGVASVGAKDMWTGQVVDDCAYMEGSEGLCKASYAVSKPRLCPCDDEKRERDCGLTPLARQGGCDAYQSRRAVLRTQLCGRKVYGAAPGQEKNRMLLVCAIPDSMDLACPGSQEKVLQQPADLPNAKANYLVDFVVSVAKPSDFDPKALVDAQAQLGGHEPFMLVARGPGSATRFLLSQTLVFGSLPDNMKLAHEFVKNAVSKTYGPTAHVDIDEGSSEAVMHIKLEASNAEDAQRIFERLRSSDIPETFAAEYKKTSGARGFPVPEVSELETKVYVQCIAKLLMRDLNPVVFTVANAPAYDTIAHRYEILTGAKGVKVSGSTPALKAEKSSRSVVSDALPSCQCDEFQEQGAVVSASLCHKKVSRSPALRSAKRIEFTHCELPSGSEDSCASGYSKCTQSRYDVVSTYIGYTMRLNKVLDFDEKKFVNSYVGLAGEQSGVIVSIKLESVMYYVNQSLAFPTLPAHMKLAKELVQLAAIEVYGNTPFVNITLHSSGPDVNVILPFVDPDAAQHSYDQLRKRDLATEFLKAYAKIDSTQKLSRPKASDVQLLAGFECVVDRKASEGLLIGGHGENAQAVDLVSSLPNVADLEKTYNTKVPGASVVLSRRIIYLGRPITMAAAFEEMKVEGPHVLRLFMLGGWFMLVPVFVFAWLVLGTSLPLLKPVRVWIGLERSMEETRSLVARNHQEETRTEETHTEQTHAESSTQNQSSAADGTMQSTLNSYESKRSTTTKTKKSIKDFHTTHTVDMEFEDDLGDLRKVRFERRPPGFSFVMKLPLKIGPVERGHEADQLGVRSGWILKGTSYDGGKWEKVPQAESRDNGVTPQSVVNGIVMHFKKLPLADYFEGSNPNPNLALPSSSPRPSE